MRALKALARDVAADALGDPPPLSRRVVLRGGMATVGLVAARPPAGMAAELAPDVRIAVVGAGLAGLTAAYDLKKLGFRAQVFEASGRLGGRCFTARHVFAGGQTAARGGEFIDSGHAHIRELARELGFALDDVIAAQPAGARPLYAFGRGLYTQDEAARDFAAILPTMQAHVAAIGDYSYRESTPFARQLDAMSAADWIAGHVPGGRASRFGALIENAVTEEQAASAEYLSGLSVPGMFVGASRTAFDVYYWQSDQRFRIRGGNDQLAAELGRRLDGQVAFERPLAALARQGDRYRLSFDNHPDQIFDRVVLAVPFSVLAAAVDTAAAGFRPLKQRSIRTLGMGNSVKTQAQFTRRVWNDLGCDGEIRLRAPAYQTTWDATRAQPGRMGVLNFWSGGREGDVAASLDPALTPSSLAAADHLLPGLAEAWTGRVIRDAWKGNPWSLGSYGALPIGYATTLYGVEREPEGHCFFAGEHTGSQSGYLNAAVQSGRRAAGEVVASLRT